MFFDQIVTLIPSMAAHAAFLALLSLGAWYAWNRGRAERVRWREPVLVAIAAALFVSSNTALSLYQNQQLIAVSTASMGPGSAAAAAAPAPLDPIVQLKAEFLKETESLLAAGKPVADDARKALFSKFDKLFKDGKKDRLAYRDAIRSVYQCQRLFLEDALMAFRMQKKAKSPEREACEGASGAFFNRDRIVPAEQSAKNDEMISELASNRTLPGPDGKPVKVEESALREGIDQQVRRLDRVSSLFE